MRNKFGLRYRTAANDETRLAKELGRADPNKKMLVEAAVRPWLRRVTQNLRQEDAAGDLLDGRGPTASKYWAGCFCTTLPHAFKLPQSPAACGAEKPPLKHSTQSATLTSSKAPSG